MWYPLLLNWWLKVLGPDRQEGGIDHEITLGEKVPSGYVPGQAWGSGVSSQELMDTDQHP